jgi:pimeloyl-ACP methyl ester carboxylesterase
VLWGRELHYVELPGSGPLMLFLHGVGSSGATWDPVLDRLAGTDVHAIALDLPGHGGSAKSRGDYSLGAMACTVRDFLDHRGEAAAVLVGHSLGGGIAMQFAYQFPERCSGLILVSSGGLGTEASIALRAASLPGAELVLPVLGNRHVVDLVGAVSRAVRRRGGPVVVSAEAETVLRGLGDPTARAAFLATLRSVIDRSGQRVSAIGKLAAARHLPTLVVWGERDRILPLEHGRKAVQAVPGTRLIVFPGARHEPHRYDPDRFSDLVAEMSRTIAAGG